MYFIYKFYDINNELLYVGKTTGLKSRFSQHVKDKVWRDEIFTVEYAICDSKSDMDIYEIYYINKLNPKYNISLVNKNDKPSIILPELNFTCKNISVLNLDSDIKTQINNSHTEFHLDEVRISEYILNNIFTLNTLDQKLLLKFIYDLQQQSNKLIEYTTEVFVFDDFLNNLSRGSHRHIKVGIEKINIALPQLFNKNKTYCKNGLVSICFNSQHKSAILPKNNFITINMSNIKHFHQKYTLSLYLLLCFNDLNWKIELIKLRHLLNCSNVHPIFSDFKRTVIETSQQEIYNYTNLNFTYDKEMLSKRIKYIKFSTTFK